MKRRKRAKKGEKKKRRREDEQREKRESKRTYMQMPVHLRVPAIKVSGKHVIHHLSSWPVYIRLEFRNFPMLEVMFTRPVLDSWYP
jgi:hypothetical protein